MERLDILERKADIQYLPYRRDQIKDPDRCSRSYKTSIQGNDGLYSKDLVKRGLEGIYRWSGTYSYQVSLPAFSSFSPCHLPLDPNKYTWE
jgi:hypothetical protein